MPHLATKISVRAPSHFSERKGLVPGSSPLQLLPSPSLRALAACPCSPSLLHRPTAAALQSPQAGCRTPLLSGELAEQKHRHNQRIIPLRRFVRSEVCTGIFSLVFVMAGLKSGCVFTWRPLFELGLFRMRYRKSRAC